MSPRRLVFIVIALFASGATIFLGRAWLSAERNARVVQAAAPKAVEKPATMVLVARGDLHAGQFVRPENLRWQAWPDDGVSKTYIVSSEHQLEDFVGAVARSSLGDGEPVTESRIVRPGDRGFLAAVLTPGYRAITVPVTAASGDAGFIFPGDHVDVIVTMSLQDQVADDKDKSDASHQHHASETVLTDLRVLALDQHTDDQSKDVTVAKTATLEVTPKQAEIISVVGEVGKLSLSLRSLAHDDDEPTAEAGNSGLSYTFDSDATHLTRPPIFASATRKVTVVRGDKVTETEFHR